MFARRWSLLFALMILNACGQVYHRYDESVSSEQQALIETDMGRLADSVMSARSAEDLKTLQMNSLDGTSLINWLGQRNRVVVGEGYDWMGENYVTSQKTSEPPQLLTSAQVDTIERYGVDRVGAGGVVTVMVNLGASIYLQGVEKGIVYTVQAGGEDIRIWSPRAAGMIQVGEGLFNKMLESSGLDSWAHTIRRGSTYVHEASHTDGNGDNRAFAHAKCPSTFYRSEFRGQYACEQYLNGAYSRQVVYLRYAIAQLCPKNGCTSAEQDALLKTLADYDSRKLSTAYYADPTPEGYGVSSLSEFEPLLKTIAIGH